MTVDIEKLRSEQGANITYLRAVADSQRAMLATEVHRACDDIEAYREIVGLVLSGDNPDRLQELLDAMTWGNPS